VALFEGWQNDLQYSMQHGPGKIKRKYWARARRTEEDGRGPSPSEAIQFLQLVVESHQDANRQFDEMAPTGPPTEQEIWKIARRTTDIIKQLITSDVCVFGGAASSLWADIGRVPNVCATPRYPVTFSPN
jgi:hypothetical protein